MRCSPRSAHRLTQPLPRLAKILGKIVSESLLRSSSSSRAQRPLRSTGCSGSTGARPSSIPRRQRRSRRPRISLRIRTTETLDSLCPRPPCRDGPSGRAPPSIPAGSRFRSRFPLPGHGPSPSSAVGVGVIVFGRPKECPMGRGTPRPPHRRGRTLVLLTVGACPPVAADCGRAGADRRPHRHRQGCPGRRRCRAPACVSVRRR